jgi:3-hydroxyisobutyrate dehydrogenase
MMRVGFVGLGVMGQPMALNLLEAGFQLTVFNRTKKKCERLAALGAAVADSPQDVATVAEVVVTMISDTRGVEEVLFGSHGVSDGAKENSVVIDTSTIAPRAAREFGVHLQAKGCELLDAPVTGGESGAKAGTLGIMVGGKREAFERCLPIFQAIGKTIIYAGPNGNGQKTKLVNQLVGAINLLAAVEGIRLASAAGLDPEETLRVVSSGAASSWMLTNLGPKILAKDFSPGFSIRLQHKDLRLLDEFITELGGDFPGAKLSYQLFSAALQERLGEQGNQGLINLWDPK